MGRGGIRKGSSAAGPGFTPYGNCDVIALEEHLAKQIELINKVKVNVQEPDQNDNSFVSAQPLNGIKVDQSNEANRNA